MKISSFSGVTALVGAGLFTLSALAQDAAAPLGGAAPADVIIYNAKVLTVNSNFTVAQALAIRDGRIVAVGKDRLLETYRGPDTRILDAQGRTVMPGLFDASVNSYKAAVSELKAPLPQIDSIAAAQDYIRREASNKPASGWIMLNQFYPTRLKEGRMPVKSDLDAATTNYAVYWNFGPMAVVNSKALALSKITRETQSPSGGTIEKDARHLNPTGLLRNAASALKLPPAARPPTRQQERDALKQLYARYNQQGITSIGEADAGPEQIDLFRDLSRSNELTVRITAARLFQPGSDLDETIERLDALTNAPAGKKPYGPTGAGDDWVRIGALKTVIDGDPNIGTAYLRTPYGIGPEFDITELAYRGEQKQDSYLLPQFYGEAAQRGWQLAGHAAGDAALDFLLNAYQKVQFSQDIHARRFLILDSAFQAAQDWQRAKDLGVGVVLEPGDLYQDGSNLMKTLGASRLTEFVMFKGWFDRGITAGGASGHLAGLDSHTAVNPWSPWLGIWTTLTRETKEGEVIKAEEQLNREQALRLYTINNAWLNFQETNKGSLEPGKLADLIVVDTDVMKCPVDQIRNTRVLLTMVDGKVVWEAKLPVLPGPETIVPAAITINLTNQNVPVAASPGAPNYPSVDLTNGAVQLTNAAAGAASSSSTNATASTATLGETNDISAAIARTIGTALVTATNVDTAAAPANLGATPSRDASNAAATNLDVTSALLTGGAETATNEAAAPAVATATNAATVITVSNQAASIAVTIQPNAATATNDSPAVIATNLPATAAPEAATQPATPTAAVPAPAPAMAVAPEAPAPAAAATVTPGPAATPAEPAPAVVATSPETLAKIAVPPPVAPATNQVTDPGDWSRLTGQGSK